MSRTRINYQLVKRHHAYTIDEAARLLGVHKNTMRNWIKAGLPRSDNSRPTLIEGHVLRDFLRGRRSAAKRPCGPGRLYCLKCREPRLPALDAVYFVARQGMAGDLRALCNTCGTMMHRRASPASIAAIMPGIVVQTTQAPSRISERTIASLNCD